MGVGCRLSRSKVECKTTCESFHAGVKRKKIFLLERETTTEKVGKNKISWNNNSLDTFFQNSARCQEIFLIKLKKKRRRNNKLKRKSVPRRMCGIGRPEFQCTEITCSVVCTWERGATGKIQ